MRLCVDDVKNEIQKKRTESKVQYYQRGVKSKVDDDRNLSKAEREKILSFKGVQPIKINENILRSETAVISAISIINYVIN